LVSHQIHPAGRLLAAFGGSGCQGAVPDIAEPPVRPGVEEDDDLLDDPDAEDPEPQDCGAASALRIARRRPRRSAGRFRPGGRV
jgi:hypothetical protein